MPTITSTELGASGRYIDFGDPASLRDLGAPRHPLRVESAPSFAPGALTIILE